MLIVLTAAVVIAIGYDAWVFYSRWSNAREGERAAQAKEAAQARSELDSVGGDKLKILNFYASPGVIRRGDHANICFGVNGAKSVRLDPPVHAVYPALNYCFDVSPRIDTEYTLYARDAAGHSVSSGFVLRVLP